MTLTLELLISCLTALGLTLGIACYIFYPKSDIDKKISKIKEDSIEDHAEIKKELLLQIQEIKDDLHSTKLEYEKNSSDIKDEIYERLSENKKALEDGMKQFIQLLSDIKEADKDMSLQFVTMITTVKEELKNDYTGRYNDLLLLINTKANEKDFNRLESKFDNLSEIIIELKTVVQLQIEEKKNK